MHLKKKGKKGRKKREGKKKKGRKEKKRRKEKRRDFFFPRITPRTKITQGPAEGAERPRAVPFLNDAVFALVDQIRQLCFYHFSSFD